MERGRKEWGREGKLKKDDWLRENRDKYSVQNTQMRQSETTRNERKKDAHVGGEVPPYTGRHKGWTRKKWFQAGVFTGAPKTHKKSCCFFTPATRVKIAPPWPDGIKLEVRHQCDHRYSGDSDDIWVPFGDELFSDFLFSEGRFPQQRYAQNNLSSVHLDRRWG